MNGYPKYSVHFIDVKDADAIFLTYQENAESYKYVILIDAGNVSNSSTIKSYLIKNFETTIIDLAVCTHPDKDHKGGFFDLMQDKEITIQRFWIKNPMDTISSVDFARMKRSDSKEEACLRIFNHPSDNSLNLIRMAQEKHILQVNIRQGVKFGEVPLWIIGPSEELYREAAIGMVSNFAELVDDPNLKKINDLEEVDENSAKNIINEEKEKSYTNMSSLVLLFRPTDKFSIILAGDASCASLIEIERKYRQEGIDGSILKVPHHGSKHNMNTDLIDALRPRASVISAAGNEKHPNSNLVYYLSKYGDVYSTHKSGTLYYTNEKEITNPAKPLKSKIQ